MKLLSKPYKAPPIVARMPAIIQVVITIFFGSMPDNNAKSSLSEYALILFPVLVLFKNQKRVETKINVTIILVSTLFWFLNKTKTGKSMRAYSDNEDLALLSGIDPKKIVMITWIIAGILATIGGALYGLDKSFKPFTYFNNMLPIFAAAIVGGIGNPFGAFLGGYVIAFSEILLTYAYKKFFMYVLPESMEPDGLVQLLSTDYKFAVSFSILVIVLLYRPSGIFKGKVL